jgi:hypothetical protein
MEKVLTYDAGRDEIGWGQGGLPRAAAPPHSVHSYTELLRKVAALAYYNKQFSLLFRGQSNDYMLDALGETGVHSHLYPSILRIVPGISKSAVDMKFVLGRRFTILAAAERKLKTCARIGEINRDQILRWALLQHYEVCPTLLLDVTSSLHVALSFAVEKSGDNAILYVLAVPQMAGVISVSIDAGTQVIRLSQVCPPEALRPHFQEALLMGNYPVLDTEDFPLDPRGKLRFNFAGRLLAKFCLNGCRSWAQSGFQPTASDILRPDQEDPYFDMMAEVADHIRPELEELQRCIGRTAT